MVALDAKEMLTRAKQAQRRRLDKRPSPLGSGFATVFAKLPSGHAAKVLRNIGEDDGFSNPAMFTIVSRKQRALNPLVRGRGLRVVYHWQTADLSNNLKSH